METLQIGQTMITWLKGGVTHMDGGAMFGVVPKPLWTRKYAVNEKNQIELRTDPLLIQRDGLNILLEAGIGSGKLNEKQIRNYGVEEESSIEESLRKIGLTTNDIHYVLMTHMHFDHACGLTKWKNGKLTSVFPQAKIITSSIEWEEMQNPNIRSANTYWKENWEAVKEQVTTFDSKISILEGLEMHHTGGHSNGHSIVILQDGGETIVHMADLMPTHAHENPLWVLAYDDYPMTSIENKQKWITYGKQCQAWFTFYHDAIYRGIKWNDKGEMIDKLERIRDNT
ncbi:YtnP family quorum-quenching lactonase [Metabacillus schmidteae]|uniref:YtnP family quorum-quenching lactonase n=1 Tax=Metabacillus schmidteae TaxID=2730405 RepID=UPI0015886CBD|nr:MBL fold metallo-hydrolase [Metabacillus schmidteae]